jgi:sigma-E factor negative regulatory protein RseB
MSLNTAIPAYFLLAVFLCFDISAYAMDPAHAWLMKISHATRTLNYEGTFVYQHGPQLETMRIIHKVEKDTHQERLVSLNGEAREIIRNDREVLCYLPNKQSVVVEHRKADGKSFPSILPERLQDLDENYVIHLGKPGRVAGRAVQRVIIKPRDDFRYGYQLWADRDTGLLLKADLLDDKGEVIEQFMFTLINVGVDIPASALIPQVPGKDMVWYRDSNGAGLTLNSKRNWNVTRLPKGFTLATKMTRKVPMRNKMAEHLVYTDGLATVSVFIEKHEPGTKAGMRGPSRMGAVNAFGALVSDHQITAVGEVPARTVALIGGSVSADQ